MSNRLFQDNGGYIGVPYTETFDPHWSNCVLALRCDGANGGTTFTDLSPSGHSVSVTGNAQTSTAQSKFYGSSLLLDGAGDRLELPAASTDFVFGTDDFTIATWLRLSSLSSDNIIFSTYNGWATFSGRFAFRVRTDGKIQVNDAGGSNAIAAGTLTTGVWYHVELANSGGTSRLFLDGTEIGSAVLGNYNGTPIDPTIGGASGVSFDFAGNMQDFRIYKGVALHTSSFSPPARPLQIRRYPSGVWSIDADVTVRLH